MVRGLLTERSKSDMSRRCDICGKGQVRGNSILRRGQSKKTGGIGQHVTAVTPRLFRPNLQVAHALVDGRPQRIKACANCIKSGRVVKRKRVKQAA